MNAKAQLVPLAAITLALAVTLTGCAGASPRTADEPAQTATIASATPTAAATTPATTAAAVTVPAAGATVPAAQVAAVRAAGGHVYVSPTGTGDGLVVDPAAPLPAVVVADTHAASPNVKWTDGGHTLAEFSASQKALGAFGKAAQAAGIKAFVLETFPQVIKDGAVSGKTSYLVSPVGMPDATAWVAARGGMPGGFSAQAAIDAAQELFAAFPGVPLVTFDAVVAQP